MSKNTLYIILFTNHNGKTTRQKASCKAFCTIRDWWIYLFNISISYMRGGGGFCRDHHHSQNPHLYLYTVTNNYYKKITCRSGNSQGIPRKVREKLNVLRKSGKGEILRERTVLFPLLVLFSNIKIILYNLQTWTLSYWQNVVHEIEQAVVGFSRTPIILHVM